MRLPVRPNQAEGRIAGTRLKGESCGRTIAKVTICQKMNTIVDQASDSQRRQILVPKQIARTAPDKLAVTSCSARKPASVELP